jgi:hypothetical protein
LEINSFQSQQAARLENLLMGTDDKTNLAKILSLENVSLPRKIMVSLLKKRVCLMA